MRAVLLALALLATGPAEAGPIATDAAAASVWHATYRIVDAQGMREVDMVCDDDTVELRVAGEPVRIWQKRPDGIEHRVVFASDGRAVVFAPGALRAVGREPDWTRVRGLVAAELRPAADAPRREVDGRDVQQQETSASGLRTQLKWLPDAGLPLRYVRKGSEPMRMELLSLRPATQAAFATGEGLRDYDAADLGDEALDTFARQFIIQGF